MGGGTKAKQGTIICQVCEEVIDIVDSQEGIKVWYGICTNCSKEKNEHEHQCRFNRQEE